MDLKHFPGANDCTTSMNVLVLQDKADTLKKEAKRGALNAIYTEAHGGPHSEAEAFYENAVAKIATALDIEQELREFRYEPVKELHEYRQGDAAYLLEDGRFLNATAMLAEGLAIERVEQIEALPASCSRWLEINEGLKYTTYTRVFKSSILDLVKYPQDAESSLT